MSLDLLHRREVASARLISARPTGLANSMSGGRLRPGLQAQPRRQPSGQRARVRGGFEYACDRCGLVNGNGLDAYCRPSVYTTVAAPSHDRNLRSLSKNISSSLLFEHVAQRVPARASTSTTATRSLHGGTCSCITETSQTLKKIGRPSASRSSGTTCLSTWAGPRTRNFFPPHPEQVPRPSPPIGPARIREAVLSAMAHVIRANNGAPSSINIAITDGPVMLM